MMTSPGAEDSCKLLVNHSSILVNNGSGRRQVLVTPVFNSAQSYPSQQQSTSSPINLSSKTRGCSELGIISKILLKAVCESSKNSKDSKAFTLRNIKTNFVCTCDDLKHVIKSQLGDEVTDNFDVGYIEGSTVVRIRSKEDLSELWANVKQPNSKVNVWCNGLKETLSATVSRDTKHKRKRPDSEDVSVSANKRKKQQQANKEVEVQDVVDDLKQKHGSKFTTMQYRIWGEMVVAGMHGDTGNPPSTSMFARAGGTPVKKSQPSSVAQLVSEAATAFTSALSPKPTVSSGLANSPAKVIESRSKLYKQLADLQNLWSTGVFCEKDYESEKKSIMELLRNLKK